MEPYWLIVVLLSPLPVLLAVALYAWPLRAQLGARLLLALMLAGSIMTIAYAGDLFGPTLAAKLFWLGFWYIGAMLTPPLLLLLAFWHIQLATWLTPSRMALVLAPVLLVLLLYFTNAWHHQYYVAFGLDTSGVVPLRTSERGPLYWTGSFVAFAYLLTTIYVLAGAWRRMAPPYSTQSAILLLAAAGPLLAGVLHALGINAFGYVNLTSLSLIITGLTYAWGIARHGVFDLAPVMHHIVLQHMHTGVVVVDGRGRIVEANPAACTLLGADRADLIGAPFTHRIAATPAVELGSLLALVDDGREVIIDRNGAPHDVVVTAQAVPEQEGALPGTTVVLLKDVTARRTAERATLERQRQVVLLEERERMARDLHDGVGQVLGYVSAQSEAARTFLHGGQIQMADALLAQLATMTQDAHADIRNFILGTQPGTQAPAELGTALAQLVQRFEAHYGQHVQLTLEGAGKASWVTPAMQTQLLYMTQEALTNIRKHAQATQATVHCHFTDDGVTLTVADDGIGFDPGVVGAQHLGLQFMQARMAEVGGDLTLVTAPGQGATVTAFIARTSDGASSQDALADLRVVIADDQPLFRDGLHNLLAARGIQVVGVAGDGAEAVRLATTLQPDVVIMDIHMPVLDGLAATEQIKEVAPQVKVLILTVAESDATLLDALRRGASGYLLKNLDAQTLFTMMAQLQRGETVLTPEMATHMVRLFARNEDTGEPMLSARQREILQLMAQGYTYREIAAKVHLSESAVKYNAGQILDRLHARTRAEAVRLAEKRGLV